MAAQTDVCVLVLFSLSEQTEDEVAPFNIPSQKSGISFREVLSVPVHSSGALAHGYTAQPLRGS